MKDRSFLIKSMSLLIWILSLIAGCSESNPADSSKNSSSLGDSSSIGQSSSSSVDSSSVDSSSIGLYGPHPGAKALAAKMGRGMNLGNALEAPTEGLWGVTLEESFFEIIADSGFTNVRIPTRWSAHVSDMPTTCVIDSTFFDRVTWAINQSLDRGMVTIVNVHHFDELLADPEKYTPCLIHIWKQLAQRYKSYPHELLFEIMNEPNGEVTDEIWNEIIAQVIPEIRAIDPYRTLLIGPGNWNSVNNFENLVIPADEKNVIGEFHFYSPFSFTHQGADWAGNLPTGITWYGTTKQKNALKDEIQLAVDWSESTGFPVYMGEFGAYSKGDLLSRTLWTDFVGSTALELGIPFSYWEFAAGFGIYDASSETWNDSLGNALLHPSIDWSTYSYEVPRPDLDTVANVVWDSFGSYADSIANLTELSGHLATVAGAFPDSAKGYWYAYYNIDSRMYADDSSLIIGSILIQEDSIYKDSSMNFNKLISTLGHDGKGLYTRAHLVGDNYPFVGVGVSINGYNSTAEGNKWFDLSKLQAISFWAKGKGDIKVEFDGKLNRFDSTLTDYWGKFGTEITLTDKWTLYVIWADELLPTPYSSLAAEGYSWSDAMAEIDQLQFSNGQGYGKVVDDEIIIQIDNLLLHGIDGSEWGI